MTCVYYLVSSIKTLEEYFKGTRWQLTRKATMPMTINYKLDLDGTQ